MCPLYIYHLYAKEWRPTKTEKTERRTDIKQDTVPSIDVQKVPCTVHQS